MMDGEASELEVRRVLKELESDSELGARWDRYHHVRSVLRKEPTAAWTPADISSRVMSALEVEPALTPAVSNARKGSWFGSWLGQSAIAAGVAAAVVVGWQPWNDTLSPASTLASSSAVKVNTAAIPKLPVDQRALVEVSGSLGGPIAPKVRAIPVVGADDDALNPYIISHAGASVLMEQVGVPAARVINVSVGEGNAQ